MDMEIAWGDLAKDYCDGKKEACYLVAIAFEQLRDLVRGHTEEEFQRRFGTFGTEALAKYKEAK